MNEDSARHINLHHHITPGICCNSANIVSIVFECFQVDVIVLVSFRLDCLGAVPFG
jgi:Cft2 family RNA processing exonuclease